MPVAVETFAAVDEAARALAARNTARVFGGGTLLMRGVNEADPSFDTLIRVTDPSLRAIESRGERVVIGSAATMADIIGHRDLGFLAPAARAVGGPAIRNMATAGGNLFAASPYGDFTTALLALDGIVHLAGSRTGAGTPLTDFLATRHREPRALVTSISAERPRDLRAFRFLKVSRIRPKRLSVMTIAAHLPESGGRVSNARVAYGAMGPVPVRALAVERALEGASLDEAGIARAISAAVEGIQAETDPVASDWYRRSVAPVHLKRLLLGREGL